MSKVRRLKDNKHILCVLKNAKSCLRNAIIKTADPEVIKAICEITLNTLNGNHLPSRKVFNQLCKYKKNMRKLAEAKRSVRKQRKVLIQRGGFVPILLDSLLSSPIGAVI